MEKILVNEISHKRISELRKNNLPTVVVSNECLLSQTEQNSVTGTNVVGKKLLLDGVNKISEAFEQHVPYSTQDSSFEEVTSKGCISKIPLIPTVTLYVLVVIIIGMALAFSGKRSRRIEEMIYNDRINDRINKIFHRTIAHGKGRYHHPVQLIAISEISICTAFIHNTKLVFIFSVS